MHLSSRFIRQEAEKLLERCSETALVTITDRMRYLAHRFPLTPEEFERISHPAFQSIVEHSDTELRFERSL
jgi:hypothetical protein